MKMRKKIITILTLLIILSTICSEYLFAAENDFFLERIYSHRIRNRSVSPDNNKEITSPGENTEENPEEQKEGGGADLIPTQPFFDLVIVGLAEGTLSGMSRTGDPMGAEEEEIFGDGFDADGRIALYVKGKVLGKYGITISCDSEDPFRERLFEDLNPDRFYPVYGDGSNYYRDGQSSKRVFVRIDLDRSYLMYGDFATDFRDTELTSYTRTFPGVKGHYESSGFNATLWGASSGQFMKRDEIPGKGMSGIYYLSEKEILEGSERIWIEVRDRDIPDIIVSSTVKIRNQDYTIDYERGTILFKEPVPTVDEFENTVHIVSQYECRGTENITNLGFRGDIKFSPDFSGGITYINEDSSQNLQLIGVHSALKINDRINLYGEYAYSHSIMGNDGAGKVELTANITPNMGINGFYRKIGHSFFNPSANSLLNRGSTQYGIEGKAFWGEGNLLNTGYIKSENDLTHTEYERAGVNYKKTFGPLQLNAGYVYKDILSPSLSFNSHIANFGIKASLNSRLSLFAGQEFDWMKEGGNKERELISTTSLGAEYLLDNGVTGYLQYDFVRGDIFNDDNTIIGFRSPIGLGENTQFFAQYDLNGARSGEKNQASIGLNTRVELFKGLKASLYYQKFIGNRQLEPSNAVALALEFLENENFKATVRYEIRSDEDDREKLLSFYGSGKLSDELSLTGRYTYSDSDNFLAEDFTRIDSHLTLGLAYRPLWSDRFSLLAKYDLRRYKDITGEIEEEDTLTHIAMLEGIYNISDKVEFYGKYAYKKEKYIISDVTNRIDLFQGRLTYKFSPRFSLFGEARYLRYLDTGERTLASILAADYLIWENWMLEGGYLFKEFQEEFNLYNREIQSQGPYIKLLLKY